MTATELPRTRSANAADLWVAVWPIALTTFVAFRVVVPLAVLAGSGSALPLFPRYDYAPLNGDANGYFDAIRHLFDAFRSVMLGWRGVTVTVACAASTVAAFMLWRHGRRWIAILLPAVGASLAATLLVRAMGEPWAPVIGWPLAWALALFPLPLFGLELTPDRAFPVGLGLSLAANGVTTVATAYLGLHASGRRSVGLAAAGLYATWPAWVGLIAGERAWENGQWNVDAGLHLYTEPLSTALVTVSLVMLLRPLVSETSSFGSGLALGFATAVKLTNGLIGFALVPLFALRHGVRRALPLAIGCLVAAPIVIAYWPKGYVQIYGGDIAPVRPYALDYVSVNWRTSTIFTPVMLMLLVPLTMLGVAGIQGWYARSILVVPVAVTVLAYSAYYVTNQHPRFYFVILPCVFVLQSAGAHILVRRARRSRRLRVPGLQKRQVYD